MIRSRTLARLTSCVAAAFLFSATSPAQELIIGSSTTTVHRAHPVAGQAQLIGACQGQVQAMAAFGDDVFLGTSDGTVYSVDVHVGFPLPAFAFVGDVRGMAVFAGTLFLATADGRLTQVDPSDGTVLSSFECGFGVEGLLAQGDLLYVGTQAGVLMTYDPATSDLQFFGPCVPAVLDLASDGQTLFASDSEGTVRRYDLATKALLGFFQLPIAAPAVAIFGGDLLAGGADGVLRRLDRHTGALKGSFETQFSIDAIALRQASAPGSVYCAGLLCPCGNNDAENGCVNSTGFGSELFAAGSASVAADDLVLYAYDVTPNGFSRYYMSQSQNALPFGDGQLCAGGGGYPAFRFGVAPTGPGAVNLGPGIIAFSQFAFGPGGTILAGSTWNFQVWYRDGAGPCGAGFNTSPGYSVTFEP